MVDLIDPRSSEPILRLRGISKSFGETQAVVGVDLDLRPGSIHALVGENGAGKSTLGRIISGVIRPDSGTIAAATGDVAFMSPRDALERGICLISQEIAIVPHLTVVDNVFLGIESHQQGVIRTQDMRRRFDELIADAGFSLPPGAVVGRLRTGEQQLVEILRALARNARVVIMDEPTAALSSREAETLYRIVRSLAKAGTAVVYVSHFLKEVLELSDEVTIMRNGAVVRTNRTKNETPDTLVEGMLGRSFSSAFPPRAAVAPDAPVVLEAVNLRAASGLHDFNLTVRAGEIAGIGGLMGSGRTEALRALYGADRLIEGAIRLDGQLVVLKGPRDAIKAGMAFVTESRKDDGLVLMMASSPNVSLAHLESVTRGSVIRRGAEGSRSAEILRELNVRGNLVGPVGAMSGGNQQKVLFGRCLFERPRVLLIDEPTRGVDVGAKLEIYRLIRDLASQGVAIVLVSSDSEELLGLAHTVHVMHQATIVDSFPADQATEHSIVHRAFGLAGTTP